MTAAVVNAGALAAVLFGPGVLWLVRAHLLRPVLVDRRAAAGGLVAISAAGGVLAAAVIGAGQASAAGLSAATMAGVVAVPVVALGLPATIVDIYEQRLPDALTVPLLTATLIVVTAAGGVTGDWAAWGRALLGGALVTGAALVVKRVSTAALGWGDVKFLPSLGVVLGWSGWDAVVGAAGFWAVLIPLTAVAMAMPGGAGRRGTVPYGPALLGGAVGALAAGS